MIRVLGDRVLVALPPREPEHTTASGLVLVKDPDLRTPTRGIVVALGEKIGTVAIDDVLVAIDDQVEETPPDDFNVLKLERRIKALRPAPFDVAINDCVLFSQFTATEQFEQDGVTYVILHETDILGVLEPLTKGVAA